MNKKSKILIVDDDPNLRKTLADILSSKGYAPVGVSTGEAALEVVEQDSPAVALIDLHLDDMPGLELLGKLTALFPSTQCIVITGYASQESAIKAVNLGAFNFIVKPYDIEHVLVTIRRAIEKTRVENALIESETRFRNMIQAAPDAIITIDQDEQILLANQSACQMFGWDSEEMTGQDIQIIIPEEYQSRHHDTLQRYLETGVPTVLGSTKEMKGKRKDGSIFPVELSLSEVRFEGSITFTGIIRDLTDRERREAELRETNRHLERRNRELRSLYDTTLVTSGLFDKDDLFARLTSQVNDLLKPDTFMIALCNDTPDSFEIALVMENGRLLSDVVGKRYSTKEGGLTGWVISQREPLLIRDLKQDTTPSIPLHGPNPARTWLGVPLIAGNRLIGVISIQSFSAHRYGDSHLQFLQSLASPVAVALDNVRLYTKEQQRADRLSNILDLSTRLAGIRDEETMLHTLVNQTASFTEGTTCTILLVDETTNEAVLAAQTGLPVGTPSSLRVPLNLPLIQRAMETGAPIILGDIDRDAPEMRTVLVHPEIRSFFAFPMVREENTIGFLTLSYLTPHEPSRGEITAFQLLAERVAAALENIRLLAREHRRVLELEALNQLAILGNQSVELDSLLQEACVSISELSGYEAVFIFLIDESESVARLQAYHGVTDDVVQVLESWNLEEGLTGFVMRTGETLSGDFSTDERALPKVKEKAPPWQSFFIVPIKVGNRIIGTINLATVAATGIAPSNLQLIETVAAQMGTIIENVRLQTETAHRLNELSALFDLSNTMREAPTLGDLFPALLEKTCEVSGATAAAIFMYEVEQETLSAHGWYPPNPALLNLQWKIGEGITGLVAESGQSYFTADLHRDDKAKIHARETNHWTTVQSFLSLPLHSSGQTIGVLNLGFPGRRNLAEEELDLLVAITNMAASALHRANLHEQTQQQLQRMTALREIDLAISASVDLGLTLKLLVDQVVAQLKVDAACVFLFNPYLKTLEYAVGTGFRSEAALKSRIYLGEGLAGRSALERRLYQVPDLQEVEPTGKRGDVIPREDFRGYTAVPLTAKGEIKGVLEIFHRSPFKPGLKWLDFLQTLAGQTAIAIDNAQLFENLQRSNMELHLAYDSTLAGWANALELRDYETEGHSQRVMDLTIQLAQKFNLTDVEIVHLRRGALLHDIGKMGIPDRILNKTGPLTEEEWAVMHKHPEYAYNMLRSIEFLKPALAIPYCHHEKWDGTGYPRGLRGKEIPLPARLFAIVDVWDALGYDRPYQQAWPESKIKAYLQEQSGKHFDPEVVDKFLDLI